MYKNVRFISKNLKISLKSRTTENISFESRILLIVFLLGSFRKYVDKMEVGRWSKMGKIMST